MAELQTGKTSNGIYKFPNHFNTPLKLKNNLKEENALRFNGNKFLNNNISLHGKSKKIKKNSSDFEQIMKNNPEKNLLKIIGNSIISKNHQE